MQECYNPNALSDHRSAGYSVVWQRTEKCCWHGWSWHRWLLHDDGQSCRKILPLQFHLDQLHGYRKLQPVHPTIFIHISQGPTKHKQIGK